jgi:glycosyltransferase involved in cell wall biosynthesis
MRVAVVGGWAPSLPLFRAPLLAELTARGHAVTAMAAGSTPQIRERLAAMGVGYHELALERTGTDPVADLRSVAELTQVLRSLRADLVFAYTIKPVVYGLLAARIAGVSRRYAMLTGLGYAFTGSGWRRGVLRRGVAAACRVALAGAGGLFVQNPDDLRDLAASGAIPATVPTTIVRGSGVDLDHFRPQPLPPGPPRFLYVGRMLRDKGVVEYVEMARRIRARHPDVRFTAVGWMDPNPSSVSRHELARWIEEGVIEYAGAVDDVRPLIASSHVLVLPSYREGTPRSVLEAMSMGRPVIVTDVAGSRETIVDGEHGAMVPPRDVDALVRAGLELVAAPDRLAAMGQRARTRAETLYDARRIAAAMADAMGL